MARSWGGPRERSVPRQAIARFTSLSITSDWIFWSTAGSVMERRPTLGNKFPTVEKTSNQASLAFKGLCFSSSRSRFTGCWSSTVIVRAGFGGAAIRRLLLGSSWTRMVSMSSWCSVYKIGLDNTACRLQIIPAILLANRRGYLSVKAERFRRWPSTIIDPSMTWWSWFPGHFSNLANPVSFFLRWSLWSFLS